MNGTRLSHRLAQRLAGSVAAAIERCGLRAFHEDRRGAALLIIALITPAMMGMTALAVDVGMWRLEQVKLQSAADAAALAAAHARLAGAEGAALEGVVARELARNGFDPAAPGNDFDVALKERDAGSPYDGVEVTATSDGDLYFGRLISSDAPTIEAAAVGGIDGGSTGRICVLGLDRTAPDTVQFRGTPDVELNCSIASNSTAASSLEITGSTTLSTPALIAAGGISGLDAGTVTVESVQQHAPPLADPFGPTGRNLQVPAPGICDVKKALKINKSTALTPGRYCGGIQITGNSTVTFAPGLYIIDGGDLKTSGQSGLIGDGVTFVLTGASPSQIGGMDFAGGAELRLSAPGEDAAWATALGYQGVLFFQDPRAQQSAAGTVDNKLLGGSIARLDGAIYFPSQSLLYSGGADLDGSCLMLVARQVMFRGNARYIQGPDDCDGMGLEPLRPPSVRLVG